MQIYIDQSGKVENTNLPTVIAYTNGKQKAIRISSSDKKQIQNIFRKGGKPGIFVYRTFAVLIYLLLSDDLHHITSIIIDTEYIGKEHLIKKYLTELIRRGSYTFDFERIHFKQIGKKSKAHEKAIAVFRGVDRADIYVNWRQVWEWIL